MHDPRYDTLGRRICASIVDLVVVLPFLIVWYTLDHAALTWVHWGLALAMAAVNTVYYVFMHARSGQTIGKRLMKVRVVDSTTEGAITLKQSFWRESPLIAINVVFTLFELALLLVEAEGIAAALALVYGFIQHLPMVWALADAGTSLCNAKRRTLHDFVGRTVVINCASAEKAPPALATGA